MNIKDNLHTFLEKIPSQIKLVAVSKTHSPEMILQAYETGFRDFGENKVQELTAKYEVLPNDIRWHFIGHLQRNKVKYLASFVHLIHGVDSLRLLRTINKEAAKNNRRIDCLLQMHIAREETKFGMDYAEICQLLESDAYQGFENVRICGLMGMATFTANMQQVEKEFKELKNSFEKLKNSYFAGKAEFKELSMGMSNDYQTAISCGSTMLRVGSLIFGARN